MNKATKSKKQNKNTLTQSSAGVGAQRRARRRGGRQNRTRPNTQPAQKGWWDITGDILSDLGSKALIHGLKILSGFGDYEVESNSILAGATDGINGGSVPIMKNSKVANIIRHREYIGDVYGSVAPYKAVSYEINPGLDGTFPWLAPIANCYTNYRMRGCVMEYVSLATEYSATPYLGYVAMATQYNSLDGPYLDKKTMENSEYANSTKPSNNLAHPIECAADQLPLTELYIRSGSVQNDADKRLYDLGRFTIATGGQSQDSIIGELWATYEIEFYFPKLATTGAVLMNQFFSRLGAFGANNVLPILQQSGNNGSSMVIEQTGPNSVLFPSETIGQKFFVEISWQGNGPMTVPPILVVPTNATLQQVMITPFTGTTLVTTIRVSFLIYISKGGKGGFSITTPLDLPSYSGNPTNQSYIWIAQIRETQDMT